MIVLTGITEGYIYLFLLKLDDVLCQLQELDAAPGVTISHEVNVVKAVHRTKNPGKR